MRSYAQYCPVAKATEILGDRWTLLIVREMLGGASGFNELQRGLPGISRSVLTDRMRALERAEVIERRTGPKGRTLEYRLTPAGRDLQPVVQAIGEWGATWSFTEPRPEELDPDLLIVWMARHVDRQRLPPNRTVVKFDFRDPKRRYWMVLEPSEVSVCLQHPGFDVDLEVIVDTTTLYRVYLGRAELGGAIRAGQLTMSGPRTLQRGFGHWFTWSAFAPASRSAQERRTAASRLASPHRVRIAEYGDPGTATQWPQPPRLHPRASRQSRLTALPSLSRGEPASAEENAYEEVVRDSEQPPLHEDEPARQLPGVGHVEGRRIVGGGAKREGRVPVGAKGAIRVEAHAPRPAQHADAALAHRMPRSPRLSIPQQPPDNQCQTF